MSNGSSELRLWCCTIAYVLKTGRASRNEQKQSHNHYYCCRVYITAAIMYCVHDTTLLTHSLTHSLLLLPKNLGMNYYKMNDYDTTYYYNIMLLFTTNHDMMFDIQCSIFNVRYSITITSFLFVSFHSSSSHPPTFVNGSTCGIDWTGKPE